MQVIADDNAYLAHGCFMDNKAAVAFIKVAFLKGIRLILDMHLTGTGLGCTMFVIEQRGTVFLMICLQIYIGSDIHVVLLGLKGNAAHAGIGFMGQGSICLESF